MYRHSLYQKVGGVGSKTDSLRDEKASLDIEVYRVVG